ncbi:MAG: 50S ribosomal protein L22 [Patescibacteria group bacterium]
MKAFLNNYRQSPRKVRLVAGLIRGKSAELALVELDFLPKRASLPIQKLLLSAISNAKPLGIEKENLFIKDIRVDKGVTLRRMMPAAMGSGHRINKRTCHVTIVLAEKAQPVKKENKKEVKQEKASLKRTVLKKVSPRTVLKKK